MWIVGWAVCVAVDQLYQRCSLACCSLLPPSVNNRLKLPLSEFSRSIPSIGSCRYFALTTPSWPVRRVSRGSLRGGVGWRSCSKRPTRRSTNSPILNRQFCLIGLSIPRWSNGCRAVPALARRYAADLDPRSRHVRHHPHSHSALRFRVRVTVQFWVLG